MLKKRGRPSKKEEIVEEIEEVEVTDEQIDEAVKVAEDLGIEGVPVGFTIVGIAPNGKRIIKNLATGTTEVEN